jgi:predicted metal-binding protein
MAEKTSIAIARLRGAPPVLLCRKCLSRVDDGKQLKRALKSELKQRSTAQGGKRARLVMTNCLGICPKRAVVATSASSLSRGEYLLLTDQTSAAAAAWLMPGQG